MKMREVVEELEAIERQFTPDAMLSLLQAFIARMKEEPEETVLAEGTAELVGRAEDGSRRFAIQTSFEWGYDKPWWAVPSRLSVRLVAVGEAQCEHEFTQHRAFPSMPTRCLKCLQIVNRPGVRIVDAEGGLA